MGRYTLSICLCLLCTLLSFGQDEINAASEYTSRGMTAYSAGEYPLAIELFKKSFALRPDYSALAYNISCCYALQGEKDSAIAWLQKTFELGSHLFLNDEDLVSLYADPRYQQLAQEAETRIGELKNEEWKPLVYLPLEYTGEKPFPVVIGEHDFQVESNRLAEQIMLSKGMRAKLVIYEGLGHAFPPNSQEKITKALQWVAAAE